VNSSPDDVSHVIRLVREVCDRWDDPAAWRRHLLQGACSLLEGNVGMMVADRSPSITAFGRPFVTMLYEHFQVSSRAELLAYFIRREPLRRRD